MFKYIKYKFNKAFEKNILYLFIFLFGISILGILLFAILLFLLQTVGLLSDENIFLQTLWYVFRLFYDQNAILSLSVEQNNLIDFISRFAVTIFGILVFSTIIGIITTFIANKVESLRSGKSKIEEENHIVFFNFSIQLVPLISELCVAYAKEKKTFVIVSNEEPLRVIERVNSIIKIPKNISIVARKGFAWQSKTLDLVNLSKAKQIIILKPDVGEKHTSELDCDVEVGKSFTYLIANENWQKNPCSIVAEFHDTSTSNLYLNYCEDIIKMQREKLGKDWEAPSIISSSSLESNLLATCINTPDLTEIYDNIFGYEGSEVYFVDPKEPKFASLLEKYWGKGLKEINSIFDRIIVLGFYYYDDKYDNTWNRIFLNTSSGFPFQKNYGLVCIAEDEDQILSELTKEHNQTNKVKEINPNFQTDDEDIDILLFDHTTGKNIEYLKHMIKSIIGLNYYNNLKGIKVFRQEVDENINDKKFLPQKPDYKILENQENHPEIGLIFHVIRTNNKEKFNFQVYSIRSNSILKSKINPGDIILNVIAESELAKFQNKNEDECSFFSNNSNKVVKKFKDYVEKLIKDKNDVIIIVKHYNSNEIDFIKLSNKDVDKHKDLILSEFEKLKEKRQKMISNIYENYIVEQKNLDKSVKEMSATTVQQYENSNCYIFINDNSKKIQKFRDNPTEDHAMINNFIGFSNLKHDNQKISDHSMITEINGYRTKRILENYKNNFFSPYMGNDVIEMNSIISKYISSATFDPKNAKLIDLLFGRVHTIKAHSLADDELKTNFCELENYFQDKNETLIGIIDYDFDKMQNRKINNITINPDQKKEIVLDKGDRLITIANFNNLEMVNHSQWLHIL
tara:strand:- start:771 stop:3335 length:2565 start_codon:yes stop_codon:yes gene_type:complete